jgi:hypothetical protein
MELYLRRATLHLEPRQILKLRDARGLRVACNSGMLWLTQEGIARDDFLGAGCVRVVETGGTVLIEALDTPSAAILARDSEASPSTAVEVASL